ncbi:MAG: PorT family protein [Bacteroidetes bacterium]|uniref:outer membrane beta-barrel protein n=1 Tax=Flavobacterium sp. TaxID=239 RepID=UPI002FD97BD7|nr:PorT family protein [Bacteroidota bacterium]
MIRALNITIPIMLKVNFSKNLTLELGPQAGFLLSQKNKFNPNDSITFDIAANIGLGYKVSKKLFAQARY